ncbi:hypothetical protein [Jannaschia formosa]|uniref:hypothetical protein n=1 Tax=Jannaschia formosa TaxID=2259592 RepID=UPI001074A45E|nr:hypothetical protein [Jannaschia formosa]TFL19781.1 hypothetical protein DR046_00040 [Jannaschia formosa]
MDRRVDGLLVWSPKRIAQEEEKLLVGTTFRERKPAASPDGRPGRSVIDRGSKTIPAQASRKLRGGGFQTEEE